MNDTFMVFLVLLPRNNEILQQSIQRKMLLTQISDFDKHCSSCMNYCMNVWWPSACVTVRCHGNSGSFDYYL